MLRFCACWIPILGLFVSGCSKIPLADDGFVSCMVAERIDSHVEWEHGCCHDERVLSCIESMLEHEIDANSAIQIALLNNPKVQALFENLGIAQADLVEAGLLSNPAFEIEIRYPHSRALKTNIEYLLVTSLLDLFLIPLKTKLATTEFEQAKLRVSNEILDLAFTVRETFYELVAERQKINYIRSILELASILQEISSRQIAVGNVNVLQYQLAQSKFLEAELNLSQSLAEIVRLREKLNRLLGLEADFCLILPECLPEEFDYQGYDLSILESIALDERLDIQIVKLELVRFCQMLGLKEGWTYSNLQVGLAGERDPDGTNLIGLGISGRLPIFNYGQAARLKLFAELRQAQNNLNALEIRVRSEVREAHYLLMSYLKIINDYRERLLPMQEKISTSSEELYNVMGLGVDKLLENKRLEFVAIKNYTDSLKEYFVSRVALDRALGGNLFKLVIPKECPQESIQ